jgi:Cu/Ag efflux pump CusA
MYGMERSMGESNCANKTLSLILPIVVLYHIPDFIFYIKSMKEALITMITVPFALIGDFMVYFMGLIYLWPLQSLSHFWDG